MKKEKKKDDILAFLDAKFGSLDDKKKRDKKHKDKKVS